MSSVRAAVLYGPRDLRVEDVPRPELSTGQVLLRVRYVGICGTDQSMYLGKLRPGKLPIVPGHEFVAEVVDVGPGVPRDIVGKRVVSEINVVCWRCWFCRHGLYTHCLHRKAIGIDLDGAMAEYVVVPVENLHEVPPEVSDEEAVFTEPLAAVVRMCDLIEVPVGGTVVVLGCGPIGLLSLQVLKLRGVTKIIAVDLVEQRLRLAQELGADVILNYSELGREELVKEVLKLTEGRGADVVVEATANPEAVDLAIDLVRPRGVLAAKSTHGVPVTFDYTKAVVKEVQIIGSRCGPFDRALNLLRTRRIEVRKLITHTYTLAQAREAMEVAVRREGIKVLLKP